VAFPRGEGELVSVLDWCCEVGAAAISFGGGSSVTGGVEPDVGDGFNGAVSVDLRHLQGVLEVDDTSRAVRVAAGTLGPALEAQLKPHGLTLRHFPSRLSGRRWAGGSRRAREYGLTETYGPITVCPEQEAWRALPVAQRARYLARQGQAYISSDLVRVVDERSLGWFHSGDLAVWHPDGNIELRDRGKDIIISGGENISSIEME
jgi:FAD binding domain/AMP-binding enzyme